jgi:RHS repeat-associated protein
VRRFPDDEATGLFSCPPHPFGGVHTSTGALPTARFPGQWFQSESGLHQNWMRDYDPTTGRYLQADPLGLVDGASVYGYGGQSPMMNIDPEGEEKRPYTLPPDPSSLGLDWMPRQNPYGSDLYQCVCSNETLRFDANNAGGKPKPHWHYYPDGNNLRKEGQYSPPGREPGTRGRPELLPGTQIMIENCNPSGGAGVPLAIGIGACLGMGRGSVIGGGGGGGSPIPQDVDPDPIFP